MSKITSANTFGRLWRLLVETHGEREGSRSLARVLAAIVDQGEEKVGKALEAALASKRADLLGLASMATPPPVMAVPAALAAYEIESTPVRAFDALLEMEPVA